MTHPSLTVKALNPHFGAEVSGLDLTQMQSKEIQASLNALLSEYAVLVFPNQPLNPTQFQSFGEIFGPLMQQQFKQYLLADHSMIGYNSTKDLPRKNGKLQVRGENYHTDHSNERCPPKATALVAVQIPSYGGDTQFVDVRQAYDQLEEDLKSKILGKFSWHVLMSSRSPRAFTTISEEEKASMPQCLQPLVIKHPESGRSALYLNTGRMEGIEGMNKEEGFALIEALYRYATSPKFEYRHQWRVGDVVIWDNRSVMHQANADYNPEEFRYLYRLMVQGVELKPADH